jgi:Phytanoyl-CoA dioxygenase (PhyH)
MTLDDAQRAAFGTRGWFVLDRVFDGAELEEIRAAYDALLAHPLRLGEASKTPFEYSALLHVQSPVLCRYATSPKLVAPMLDLLGPDVRLYWDQAVSKPPGTTSDVPWHQDNGYALVEPEEYVTCTVALDATTRDNGCLWIQPGSHATGFAPTAPPTSTSRWATASAPLRLISSHSALATTPNARSRRRIAKSSIIPTSNSGTSSATSSPDASASATTCSGSPPHPIPARITSFLAATSVTLQRKPPSSTFSDGESASCALSRRTICACARSRARGTGLPAAASG